jgi:eukaryotic-like serine/threonine-protein kinase
MPLAPGSRFGPYSIETPLGAGGMGEVYRARDTVLNRAVAIKIVPDLFAGDPERMGRFSREAQTLAALNHPNIAHVYGLEGSGLVMELVDGQDLAERLTQGPLPLDDALPIAKQIVEALEAAHNRGIVHRDLKPANIKVRADGVVKVLDFGLAKALDPASDPASSDSNSPTVLGPTLRSGLSQQGIILGTAAYMAPEQAKGKAVDKRADVWAFGCVLFEMLTGKMAFPGDNITEILAAVVRGEPDWTALPADTPASVQRLLRRCLTKEPRDRLSDIGVARLEIRDASDVAPSREAVPQVAAVPRTPRGWWMLAAGVVGGAMVSALAAWSVWPTPSPLPALRFAIDWPEGLTWAGPSGPGLAISPDGTRVAYVAISGTTGPQICVQDLRSGEMRVVSSIDLPYGPFFSPDSTQVGFMANGKLWRAPVAGGTPFEIGTVDVNDRGVAWSDDGFIYSGGGSGISRISESGGTREPITSVDKSAGEVAHRFPAIVPGRRGVLFTVFKGSLEEARVAVVDVTTKKWRVLLDRTGHAPIYVPTGHLLYLRTGVLMAARFDASRLEVTTASTPVMSGVLFNNGGAGHYGVSSTGTIAYMPDSGSRPQADLVWVDRTGRITATDLPRGPYSGPALSPDGTRVALESSTSPGRQSLVVWDFARRTLTPITRDSSVSEAPIWTADGTNLFFVSRPQLGALGRLVRQRSDGADAPTQLTSGSLKQVYASGGEHPAAVLSEASILYAVTGTDADGIKQLDLTTGASQMVVPSGRTARLSPDGRWLAYRTVESGLPEIYMSPYPNVASARWQVSNGPTSAPRWSRDSTELYYRGLGSNRSHMYVLKVGAGTTLGGARPQVLTDVPDSGNNVLVEFDVGRDGRFLILKGLPQQAPVPHVIVNWFDVLRQAMPADAQITK